MTALNEHKIRPPFWFVRDKRSRVAHHWDYERDRANRALCGHEYEDEIVFEGETPPNRVCRDCQEVLPRFAAKWWCETAQKHADRCARLERRCEDSELELRQLRSQIEKLTYQLGLSEGRNETLKAKVANQRKHLHNLQSSRAATKQGPVGPRRI